MKNKSGKDPNANKNSNPVRSGKFNWKLLLILTVNTIVILGFYLLTTNYSFFEYVLAAYMILTAGFSIAFVVYNRGFSRRGVTLDMLPDTMTPEEKTEFIANGENRLKKSFTHPPVNVF